MTEQTLLESEPANLPALPSEADTMRGGKALTDLRQAAMLLPVEMMQAALSEYVDRRRLFRKWLLSQMVQGRHYGFAPGCQPRDNVDPIQWEQKPGLYKAGAELVCDLMDVEGIPKPDIDAWKMLGEPAGTFVMRCTLVSRQTKKEIGQGVGAFKVGEKKGMNENGAVKMAAKRAKVDAVLNTYGLSDLFTQDVGEDGDDAPEPNPQPQANRNAPKARPRSERSDPQVSSADILKVINGWRAKFQIPPPADKEEHAQQKATFAKWVKLATGREFTVSKVEEWELDDLLACEEALK